MPILDKHNISQTIYSGALIPKKSNVRQAKFRINISIFVIWTQLSLGTRTGYPYSAHRRLWSDCASVIKLHVAHMQFVKYCFAAAYQCQPSSFFWHTSPPHIVTSCDKSGRGCRQTDEVLYWFNSAKQSCSSEYYDNNLIIHIFVSSCPLFVLTSAVSGVIMQLPLG